MLCPPWSLKNTRQLSEGTVDIDSCDCRPPQWKVYVDMFLNLPYPHWYKEFCALHAPEEVEKYDDLVQQIRDVIGASPDPLQCRILRLGTWPGVHLEPRTP